MESPPIDSHLTIALETQTRALLSELDKRLSAIDSKWEARVGALESSVADALRHLDVVSIDVRVDLAAHQATVEDAVGRSPTPPLRSFHQYLPRLPRIDHPGVRALAA